MGFSASDVPYKNEVAEGADEVTFSCYTDNASRIKKTYNGTGTAGEYWLRSPLSSSTAPFCFVSVTGAAGHNYGNATNSNGVAFGFSPTFGFFPGRQSSESEIRTEKERRRP